jgi:hypothetical protein
MSKERDKNQYRMALKQIEQRLRDAGHSGEVAQLLRPVDRFTGELRRTNASLKRQLESTDVELQGAKRQLQTFVGLPERLEELERACNRLEIRRQEYEKLNVELRSRVDQLTEKLTRSGSLHLADESFFTLVKVKCLECQLHFTLCTWEPDRHTARTIHCPECGQHRGHYMVWRESGLGFIFQHVPGRASLEEIKLVSESG